VNESAASCMFCGAEIPSPRYAYRELSSGFVKVRAQGGDNQVRLRKFSGKLACTRCVDRMARGTAPTQESLL